MHLLSPRSWFELALGALSLVMFLGTLLAIPVFLVKVPDDYFARPRKNCGWRGRLLRWSMGTLLIVVGAVMLVLPGQGLLTIFVGLALLDLPMNPRILGRILRVRKVRTVLDSVRRKAGKGPLHLPAACGGTARV